MTKEELKKENAQLKAIWDSFIKKEEDWDKERHAWMQERFDFKNKITGLEKLIEKMKNCRNCDKEYTNNPDCKDCKYSRKYDGKQDKWEMVLAE